MATPYCRHIRTNGLRCCSFAVRGQALCYFHRSANARHRSLNPPPQPDPIPTIIHPLNTIDNRQRSPILAEYFDSVAPHIPSAPLAIDFPALEDRESIQLAISMLISALGQNRLDPRRASTILYGLQVASANARTLRIGSERHIVRDTVLDATGQELAPDEDPGEIIEFDRFLAEIDEEEEEDESDSDHITHHHDQA